MRFLTADWRHVCLLTYACPKQLLEPRCPPGTELDLFEGQAHVSLVAFDFLRTRVLGIGWPGFPELPRDQPPFLRHRRRASRSGLHPRVRPKPIRRVARTPPLQRALSGHPDDIRGCRRAKRALGHPPSSRRRFQQPSEPDCRPHPVPPRHREPRTPLQRASMGFWRRPSRQPGHLRGSTSALAGLSGALIPLELDLGRRVRLRLGVSARA